MLDFETRKDEVRPIPVGDLEVVQLDDNHAWSMKIWSDLPFKVKIVLIKCLRANMDILSISPNKTPYIDHTVGCHQLSIDPNTRYSPNKKIRPSLEGQGYHQHGRNFVRYKFYLCGEIHEVAFQFRSS